MSPMSAVILRPNRCPMATISSASSTAAGTVSMNAPCPTLTSSTIASAPAAIFFDIIDEAMSGREGTVPVTSRSAYSLPSAGARSCVCPATTSPISLSCRLNRSRLSRVEKPGIDSSLSSVPPENDSPRPDILPTGTPRVATIGPTTSVVLSPTPPEECLSTMKGRVSCRLSVAPEKAIASVSAAVSACVIPRKKTAIAHAAA